MKYILYCRKSSEDKGRQILSLDSQVNEMKKLADTLGLEIKKEFSPGKYIASKTGKKYHIPKCDWAKRIKESNRIWFDSKEEAEEKGLKACDCIN